MNIRAVIFDIYATVLEVGPAPADADSLWQALFAETLGAPPPMSRTEFSLRTSRVVTRQHAAARARGIPWPEIVWPAIVLEVIPGLARLSAAELDEFIFRQMQIGRTLRRTDGAAECLRWLISKKRLLGIASNSQAYTSRELELAFRAAGLDLSLFDPGLRFWSFEHGFSKPDPHVFRILTSRLETRGISATETLMVGDRFDNDIEPARAFGWQTWQLAATNQSYPSGNWHELLAWLEQTASSG